MEVQILKKDGEIMTTTGSSRQLQAVPGSLTAKGLVKRLELKIKKRLKMSSNIRIKKVCQHCKQLFIAQTTVTKFCSLTCARRNYKKRLKESKITKAILETNQQIAARYDDAASMNNLSQTEEKLKKDWLNIQDVAELLGVGKRTLFRLVKNEKLPNVKIGRRLIFNKQEVLNYFTNKSKRL
jgi:excisionase family DNA binding protein